MGVFVFVKVLFRCVSFARPRFSSSRDLGFEQFRDKVLSACWPILVSRGRHAFTKIFPFRCFLVGHLAKPSFQVVVFFTVVLWCVSLRDCPDVWMSVGCQLPTGAAIESIDDLVEVKLSSLRFFQCAHPPEGHIARI